MKETRKSWPRAFPPEICARHRADGYWGEMTLSAMFAETAARAPERLALVDPPNRAAFFEGAPRRFSYREMSREIDRYAAAFRRHGIGAGALVATQLPNISELVIIFLALAKIGAIVSPISIAYRANELRAMTSIVDFDAYICVGNLRGAPFYAERAPSLPASVKKLGLGADLPAGVTPLLEEVSLPHPAASRDAVALPHPAESRDAGVETPGAPEPAQSADDLFAIFWTSGTEGVPKAVPKTHNNMMASSLGAWRLLNLPDGANILAPFPFVNAAAVGGLMMCWMRTGGALVLHNPFDADIFMSQLAQENVGYTMMSPTVLSYLRDRADHPALAPALANLIAIGTGSAPPDPETFRFFQERFGVPVVNFFGSNEGAQMGSTGANAPDPYQRAASFPRDGDISWTKGLRTANGGWFKLVDRESGQIVSAPGAIGEMFIDGPSVLPGYFSRDGFDRSRFDADGYLATGDLFRISACGRLIQFHSRARELISRGGMKISPVELDHFFASLPGVREASVASYPDATMGERVCLCVALQDGVTMTLEDIAAFCDRRQLARFKWPERLMVLSQLPVTSMGKRDRRALEEIVRAAPK